MCRSLTLALSLLTLAGLSSAHAQQPEDFDPGYVITSEGDTLRGQIGQLIDLEAAHRIVFLPEDAVEPVELSVHHAVAYGLDTGRRHVRRTFVPSDGMPEVTLFVLVLVEGDLSLYSYALHLDEQPLRELMTDPDIRERFVVEDSYQHVIGLYRLRWARGGDVRQDRQYARVLEGLYGDCPVEQRRLRRLNYSRGDLVASVSRYNECIGAEAFAHAETATERRSDVSFGYAIRAGAGQSRIRSAEGSAVTTITHYLGIGGEWRLNAIPGRNALILEVALQRRGGDEEQIMAPYAPESFQKHVLGLSLGWRQVFGRELAPYASAGILAGLWLGPDSEYWDDVSVIERVRRVPYRNELGLFAELGAEIPYRGPGTLSAGLRLERTGFYKEMAPGRFFRDVFQSNTGVHHAGNNLTLVAGLRF